MANLADLGDLADLADVDAALAPVLRDVSATTDVTLTYRLTVDEESGPYVAISTSGGSSAGIWIQGESLGERVGSAAGAIQDLIIAGLGARASNWPMCPAHRSTHPMEIVWESGEPWWGCPADSSATVAVGSLRL